MIGSPPPPFDQIWFHCLLGGVIGACLGSFATMLAYRLPRGLSIVLPRSYCTRCNTVLRPHDLVPLLSYLGGKGKCRYCRVDIGARYFWIECGFCLAGAVAALVI